MQVIFNTAKYQDASTGTFYFNQRLFRLRYQSITKTINLSINYVSYYNNITSSYPLYGLKLSGSFADVWALPIGTNRYTIGTQQVHNRYTIGTQQVPIGTQQVPIGTQQVPIGTNRYQQVHNRYQQVHKTKILFFVDITNIGLSLPRSNLPRLINLKSMSVQICTP